MIYIGGGAIIFVILIINWNRFRTSLFYLLIHPTPRHTLLRWYLVQVLRPAACSCKSCSSRLHSRMTPAFSNRPHFSSQRWTPFTRSRKNLLIILLSFDNKVCYSTILLAFSSASFICPPSYKAVTVAFRHNWRASIRLMWSSLLTA